MKTTHLMILAVTCAAGKAVTADELVLAENGHSAYQIVVADDASPSTKHAAVELQTFLRQITAATFPIASDRQPIGTHEIVLGDNAHRKPLGAMADAGVLGEEGYVIRTVGNHLVIVGGRSRGTLYGAYGFLEDHLGCRWFTPQVSRIPKSARLAIGPINDRQVPAFEYRESYIHECFDGQWCARNRIHSSRVTQEANLGGKVWFGDGFFCHTFERLVPPEKYFDAHPEYFAMINGQRQKLGQLCCTNPDVIRLCTEGVRKAMQAQPNATIFSVSQNDGGDCGCQCPTCQDLARQEDSQIAPALQLANRVAEAVEKEFPAKIVETLAYTWGRRPPKQMRPRSNVLIRYCWGGECCYFHPFATCDSDPSREFRTDLERWAKIAPRLWTWDYVANFNHYLLPHPNLRSLGPNIRYQAAHNVKGIFAEGVDTTPNSEFAALRGYMLAKLLWNPNYDADKAMGEFLEAYYGRAAASIREYIDTFHNHVEHENIHVTDVAGCESLRLSDQLLVKANQLWQQAETCVAAEPEVLQRVKLSRVSVDCAILEQARLQLQRSPPANGPLLALAATRFAPFCETLRNATVAHLNMSNTRFDKQAYCRDMARVLGLKAQ